MTERHGQQRGSPGSVVLHLFPLVEAPVVITGETPPEANPVESDMTAINSLPFAIGNVVENVPLLLLNAVLGMLKVLGVPYD